MKIDGVKNRPISSKPVKKKGSSPKNISFMNLLDEQLHPVNDAQATKETTELQKNSTVSTGTRLAGLTLSERTIEGLESLGEALKNLDLEVDDLKPLVDALESDTTAMLDIKEQLDADDPLAELLDRVAAVAYLESEKYRRGDYGD